MGKYEDQLAALGADSAHWEIDYLDRLTEEIAELERKMRLSAAAPGWTGSSADAAAQKFTALEQQFKEVQVKLDNARKAIETANTLRADAVGQRDSLPAGGVPWYLQPTLTGLEIGSKVLIPGIGTFLAEVAVQKVTEFFGAQREAAAKHELELLEQALVAPRKTLADNLIGKTDRIDPIPPKPLDWPGEPVVWSGDSDGNGGWSTGGGWGGGNGGGVPAPPRTHVVLPPEPPRGWPYVTPKDPPTVAVDSHGGGSSSFTGMGGLGAGLVGAGAGAGALGVSGKLASSGVGSGGGLFAGGSAAGGAGAAGKGSSAMMGGAPGGGGAGDKEKRASLGLVAPKLEDDDEPTPRSSAAGAGGRE